MKRFVFLLPLLFLSLVPGAAQVQLPLPVPLKLPPGLEQTLQISSAASYLADATRIQDCPEDKDAPLGLCNNFLYGGSVLFASPISGKVRIRFSPPVNNVTKFEISLLEGLRGEDVVERAPILFAFKIKNIFFTNAPVLSTGELDLTTGGVKNFDFRVYSLNNKLAVYLNVFTLITTPELRFPGVYGTALARFSQRPDGLLDFSFYGATFVPMGNNLAGKLDDKVRVITPFCLTPELCRAMEGPGTTLRPRVYLTSKDPEGPECGANCPNIPLNTIKVFNTSPYNTLTGDRFDRLNIPELGGPTTGWSHLSGRIWMQFGDRYGDMIPVIVWAIPPEGFLAEPPANANFPGFGLNLLGVDGKVTFPNYTYTAVQRFITNDPFDFTVGVVNAKTGRFIGDLIYRGLPLQDLFLVIQGLNAGRIPTATFQYQGPASFENGPNGELVFLYNGKVYLDFSSFAWPLPDYNLARSFRAGDGSLLEPFLKIQGALGGPKPIVVKSGEISENSKFGEPLRLRYSIPCDPLNQNFTFEYTNFSNSTRGGTFRMESLTSVSCTNTLGSTARPGDADVVSFSGLGTWSKDSDDHLVTVEISTKPGERFWIIQVDGSLISSGETDMSFETEER